jgi:hypothetical protein
MTEAECHRSEPRTSYSATLLSRFRYSMVSIVRESMVRDSFYFLIAALSLALAIGWVSFVTIAARA